MRFFLYLGFYVGVSLITSRCVLAEENPITQLKNMFFENADSKQVSFDKPDVKIQARALSAKSKADLYKEQHNIIFNKQDGRLFQTQTLYFDLNGARIAQLVSDYSSNLKCPNYFFEDLRLKYNEGVMSSGDHYLVFHKDQTTTISRLEENIFCGQGWHYYFMSHLESLMLKGMTIKLILPGKLDYFSFKMKKVSQVDHLVIFNLDLASWLLRLFAPSMELSYEIKSRRLQSYKGPSNLLDKKGKTQDVLIRYKN